MHEQKTQTYISNPKLLDQNKKKIINKKPIERRKL